MLYQSLPFSRKHNILYTANRISDSAKTRLLCEYRDGAAAAISKLPWKDIRLGKAKDSAFFGLLFYSLFVDKGTVYGEFLDSVVALADDSLRQRIMEAENTVEEEERSLAERMLYGSILTNKEIFIRRYSGYTGNGCKAAEQWEKLIRKKMSKCILAPDAELSLGAAVCIILQNDAARSANFDFLTEQEVAIHEARAMHGLYVPPYTGCYRTQKETEDAISVFCRQHLEETIYSAVYAEHRSLAKAFPPDMDVFSLSGSSHKTKLVDIYELLEELRCADSTVLKDACLNFVNEAYARMYQKENDLDYLKTFSQTAAPAAGTGMKAVRKNSKKEAQEKETAYADELPKGPSVRKETPAADYQKTIRDLHHQIEVLKREGADKDAVNLSLKEDLRRAVRDMDAMSTEIERMEMQAQGTEVKRGGNIRDGHYLFVCDQKETQGKIRKYFPNSNVSAGSGLWEYNSDTFDAVVFMTSKSGHSETVRIKNEAKKKLSVPCVYTRFTNMHMIEADIAAALSTVPSGTGCG